MASLQIRGSRAQRAGEMKPGQAAAVSSERRNSSSNTDREQCAVAVSRATKWVSSALLPGAIDRDGEDVSYRKGA